MTSQDKRWTIVLVVMLVGLTVSSIAESWADAHRPCGEVRK